ncbi:3-oxoacyl-[acyl-carrier-protein] reductase FabG [Chlamydiales bacterium STE3]|nr:3-oxoacyl-[acyl-carrier-protein] reductase FabG [Chlamydiales bacterium STE3]
MNQMLRGKVAIVTGGTSGIGFAIASTFVEQGARVIVLGTNSSKGHQSAEEINCKSNVSMCTFYQADVSRTDEVDHCLKDVLANFSKVDILVNNAGITRDQLLMKMNEQDWDDVMAVNIKSCYNTCHFLARPMLKARSGKIINISSVVGLTGNAGQVNYAASKGAMVAFSKALALEFAPRNILVNCIAPGFIETNMTSSLTEAQRESILSKIPLGRMGLAQEVANAALFLATDLSSYMTGQVITVDGGMVM